MGTIRSSAMDKEPECFIPCIKGHFIDISMYPTSGHGLARFDMLASLPVELVFQVANHLEPVDLISARRVSKRWRRLLSSTELCNAALCYHFPGQFALQTAQVVDPATALFIAAKRLHAFRTGRPVKKASYEYTRGAIPFLAGKPSGVFADYFQGKIAWKEGSTIKVCCLETGTVVDYSCERAMQIWHLKLSDRLVVAVTYDGTCYAYDQITGERSSIALGMAAISWLAVRGLDVAFRSNQKVEPLVIWRFGERKVKAVDAVPFTGPLVFHPKLDVIEIFYLKKIERDYFAGRWIAFNYGDLTAMSTREVHEKARAWSSGKYSARAKRRSLEKRMVRRAVVLNNINRGSYQFVDGLFFGLIPLWSTPIRTAKPTYENQVAYMHNGTMYIASGNPTDRQPIMVHDLTEQSPIRVSEVSEILYDPLQSSGYRGANGITDPFLYRAALMGDDKFMVQVGHTNINVWGFDENVPLANENVEYGQEVKRRAEKRARMRELDAVEARIREFSEEPSPVRSASQSSSMRVSLGSTRRSSVSSAPSSVIISPPEIPNHKPHRERRYHRFFSKTTKTSAKTDGANIGKGQPRRTKLNLRRGIYKLVVKAVGPIL